MSEWRSYRDESRKNYGREFNDGAGASLDEIQQGALLRIADAVEKVAKRHDDLIADRDYWKRRAQDSEAAAERLRRSNNALRGVIKRMKAARQEGAGR